MRYFWLTLVDAVTGKKKMKKVMLLKSAAKEVTLEFLSKVFFDLTLVDFSETAEAGI